MLKRFRLVLLLVGAFLLGTVTINLAGAGTSATCDWKDSSSSDIFRETANGFETPEEALKQLQTLSSDLRVPDAAVVEDGPGDDYAKVRAVSLEGHVSYSVHIDGVARIEATVLKFEDGTYGLSDFRTCFGV